jgi:hypothetical protein
VQAQADAIMKGIGDGQTVQQGLKKAELAKAEADAQMAKTNADVMKRYYSQPPAPDMFQELGLLPRR